MVIDIDRVLRGESFRRGNSTFPSAEEILTPYLQATEDVVQEYRVNVISSKETVIESQGDLIETINERPVYTRVHIDGILKPEYQLTHTNEGYSSVISTLYALDIQTPIMKLYTGFERHACLNTSIFNPRHILEKKFTDPDFDIIYQQIPTFVENQEIYKREYENALDNLNSVRYAGEDLFTVMGKLAFKVANKPGMQNSFNNAVKFLRTNQDVNNIKNIYFNPNWETQGYSAFDLYQSLTATLSNKGNKEPEKIYQAYKLIVA